MIDNPQSPKSEPNKCPFLSRCCEPRSCGSKDAYFGEVTTIEDNRVPKASAMGRSEVVKEGVKS